MKPVHIKLLVTSGLIWGCSFAILGAAYMCLVFPQGKAERDINAKLAERRTVYDQYKVANSEKSRTERRETIAMLDKKLTLYVAEELTLHSLPFDITEIANRAKVSDLSTSSKSLIDESFLEIQNCNYIGYTLIDLKFTASFDKFASVVNTLERNYPIIFIDMFSIDRNEDKPSENVARLGLSVFIHNTQGASDTN